MANRYLYVETDAAYNFRIEIGEHETRPEAAIVMDWMRQVQSQGMYYHEEDKAGFPYHSILQVTLKEDKR
jgi:hypothetical protein